ncbi:MAG TPA: divalent-cation tolerance protein CutA [Polyangiaceae bacterium]|nr:divalent-cation tolerance protein CutA [Polyangiaceae bacterium]
MSALTESALVVLCTVPDEVVAERIAHALLDGHLAACVNILPQVRSIYRFEGKIEDSRELLLIVKTTRERYYALESRIKALHPYKVCEILAFDLARGSAPYLQWLVAETSSSAHPDA